MTFQELCNMSLTFYTGDHYLIMVLCAAVHLNNSSVVKEHCEVRCAKETSVASA